MWQHSDAPQKVDSNLSLSSNGEQAEVQAKPRGGGTRLSDVIQRMASRASLGVHKMDADEGRGRLQRSNTVNRRHLMMKAVLLKREDEDEDSEDMASLGYWQNVLYKIVSSPRFDALMATVVAVNLITMALEPELPEARNFFTSLDWVYNVIYTIEVAMRLSVYGRFYFYNAFNILDLCIVISGWITSVAEVMAGDGEGPLASMGALKVLRALRSFRLFRMISFFEGVWIVFSSFLNCIKPLIWTCIFVLVIIFIFAMFAVELIGTSNSMEGVENRELFRSTAPAMITLFQIMTLDDWRSITRPLCIAEWWTYFFFFAFVCVSALALMNMVTAVVVENSMEHMSRDEDIVKHHVLEEHAKEKAKIQSVLRFFRNEGNQHQNAYDLSASPADLLKARSTWAALEEILDALDLHREDEVMRLMVLLDADGNGDISVAELLEGFLELRVLTRDKHRVALLHAMESNDYKFSIIERSLAETHAPVDIAASLHRIQDMLDELGIDEPKPSLSERPLFESQSSRDKTGREESPPMSDSRPESAAVIGGSSAAGPPSDLRHTAQAHVTPSSDRDGARDGPVTPPKTFNDDGSAQEVVRELRAFRQSLQHNGQELEHQAASIQRMQEAVGRMRQERDEQARRGSARFSPAWSS